MTEEEKEELQELINLLYNGHISQYGKRKLEEYINKLQKENDTLKTTINKQSKDISEQLQELDKKDKVIDLMAEEITYMDYIGERPSKNHIKEKFYKKVEGENDN